MPVYRHIVADLVRALAVLGIVFLSFGHQPVAAVPHGPAVLTVALDASFCGDMPENGRVGHPCHACRVGGSADVPPDCGGVLHLAAAEPPAFPELAAPAYIAPPPQVPAARGPPRLA